MTVPATAQLVPDGRTLGSCKVLNPGHLRVDRVFGPYAHSTPAARLTSYRPKTHSTPTQWPGRPDCPALMPDHRVHHRPTCPSLP